MIDSLEAKVPDAAAFPADPGVQWTYTILGQRATMVDATGTTTYTYDLRGRLTQKATPQGTLNYTYDALGRLASISSTTVEGTSVHYRYDELSRLNTVTDDNLGATSYTYTDVGSLHTVNYPNAVKHAYSYSNRYHLLGLHVSKPGLGSGSVLADYAYTVNLTGRRTQAAETLASPSNTVSTERVADYTYDALWRLTTETISGSNPGPSGSIGYTLDAVGNRLTRTSTVQGVLSQSSTYDANDRIQGNGYDANGNTTSSSVEHTGNAGGTAGNNLDAYDHAERLTTRTNADGSTVQLAYNGDGILVRKVTTLHGVTTTTEYLVDELNPTGYSQVVEEKVNGQLSATYTYGHDLISQDRRDGSGTWSASFYGYDGHGNTRLLINEAGAVTDTYTYTYEAFGQLIHTQSVTGFSGTANAYLYCGERYVAELGLYHLRARMMNALSGRFWNMDTWEGNAAQPGSLNKYLYCSSEPLNGTDPSGNFTISQIGIGLSTASLVYSLAQFAIAPSWENAAWLALDVSTFPLSFVKAVKAAGIGLATLKATIAGARSAKYAGLEARVAAYIMANAKHFLRGDDMAKLLQRVKGGDKVPFADFFYRGDFAGYVLIEAKKTLQTSSLKTALNQLEKSVEQLKRLHHQGLVYAGTEELIIAYDRIGGLAGYTIDSAGHIYQNGVRVLIDGVPVVAKYFP